LVFRKKGSEEVDFDIEDVENYRGEPDLKYSQELLVMEQYRRCLKSGSQEMKKGSEEVKRDRIGNVMVVKINSDTRKEFGECVNTLKNLMIGDITADKISKVNIPNLYKELEELKEKYINLEEEDWKKIPEHIKRPGSPWADRWDHLPGTLNLEHYYGEKYLQGSVEVYRRILEEIGLLLYRMGYFRAERIT